MGPGMDKWTTCLAATPMFLSDQGNLSEFDRAMVGYESRLTKAT